MSPYIAKLKHRLSSIDSYSVYRLDRKIRKYLPHRGGTFVELGANNGIKQSNTYLLEKKFGWTGILIEPLPDAAEQCRRNRPKSQVFNVACTTPETAAKGEPMEFLDCDLMSFPIGAFSSKEDQEGWVRKGEAIQRIESRRIKVPCTTLTQVLQSASCFDFDLLSLDVEGYETSVLEGLDLRQHRPLYMLIEVVITSSESISQLVGEYYDFVGMLSPQDGLWRRRPSPEPAGSSNSVHK